MPKSITKTVKEIVRLSDKTMMLLRVSDLKSGATYQAVIDSKRVDTIRKSYDPSQFGFPVINKRSNDEFIIVDGQHRINAYIHLLAIGTVKDDYIWCEVREGLTVEQEAILYNHLAKNRRKVNPIQQYRAAMVAKDLRTWGIDSALKKSGMNVPWQRYAKSNKNSITCIATLYKAFDLLGEDSFKKVCRILVAAFHNPLTEEVCSDCLTGEFFGGLATFYASDKNTYSDKKIIAKLIEECASGIVEKAYENQRMKNGGKRNSRNIHVEVSLVVWDIMRGKVNKNSNSDDYPEPPNVLTRKQSIFN